MKIAVKRLLVNASIGLGLTVTMLAQPTYNISTVMGSYNLADTSTAGPLGNPMAVAVDSSGNVYFTDTMGNRVRQYNPTTGVVTTIAGDGTFGANGQNAGGPAVKMKLWQPQGVAVDSAGNVYIADSFDHVIIKVDTTGVGTILAGTPNSGAFNGDGTIATAGRMRNPNRLFVDSNNVLYFADKENNRIRKVTTDGVLHTVAGFGGDSTTTPHAFSGDVGSFGTLCTANQAAGVPCTGIATQAGLGQPQAVAVDSYGNVFIADTANNRIRMVSKTDAFGNALLDSKGKPLTDSTAIITTVAGGGSSAQLDGSCTSTCAAGASGIGGSVGSGTFNSNPLSAVLSAPAGLAMDASNNLYISDTGNNRVLYLNFNRNATCTNPSQQGCTQTAPSLSLVLSGLSTPEGIAFSGNELYVAEAAANRIRQFDLPSQTSTILVAAQTNPFVAPRGLAVDATGDLWISDTLNNRISEIVPSTGAITRIGGTGTAGFPTAGGDDNPEQPIQASNSRVSAPWGGAFDAAGNFYFADRGNNRVREITVGGNITTIAGGNNPAIPPTGFTKPPTVSTGAGFSGDGLPAVQGQLRNPAAVGVDAVGGNGNCATAPCVYIADTGNDVIRKVDSFGNMTTFAGFEPICAQGNPPLTGSCTGVAGASGDGLLATDAQLNLPLGVTVDGLGNVYIADTSNHVVRKVTAATGYITTVAGELTSEGRGGDAILAVNSTNDYPVAVTVDSAGNVFYAESCTNIGQNTIFTDTLSSSGFNRWGTCETSRIRRVDATTGMVSTLTSGAATAALGTGIFGGDGAASSKALALYPTAVAVDSTGNVYFTDFTNRIRKLTPVTTK